MKQSVTVGNLGFCSYFCSYKKPCSEHICISLCSLCRNIPLEYICRTEFDGSNVSFSDCEEPLSNHYTEKNQ